MVGASTAAPKKGGGKDKRKRVAYDDEEEEEEEHGKVRGTEQAASAALNDLRVSNRRLETRVGGCYGEEWCYPSLFP